MLVGGVDTHRMDLSSMVMLKDNHMHFLGAREYPLSDEVQQQLQIVLQTARRIAGFTRKICMEVHSGLAYEMAKRLPEIDIIMMDNFLPESIKNCVESYGKLKGKILEVSGGINLNNVASYMVPCKSLIFSSLQILSPLDVDVISTGQLTQGTGSVDFSMKLFEY